MDAAGDWFEIMNGKSIRIIIPVVSHNIKWMGSIEHLKNIVIFFHLDQKLTPLVMGFQCFGFPNVPLAVRGMFQQLPKPVSIFFGHVDGVSGIYYKKSIVFRIKINLVDYATGDHQIISVFEIQIPKKRTQYPAALMDKDNFICIGVLIKVRSQRLLRCRQNYTTIGVGEHGLSAVQIILFRPYPKTIQS